jgi:hypothetical protein
MGKSSFSLGSDWIYIALGAGALYAIYSVSKPTVKTIEGVGNAATDAANSGASVVDSAAKNTDNVLDKVGQVIVKALDVVEGVIPPTVQFTPIPSINPVGNPSFDLGQIARDFISPVTTLLKPTPAPAATKPQTKIQAEAANSISFLNTTVTNNLLSTKTTVTPSVVSKANSYTSPTSFVYNSPVNTLLQASSSVNKNSVLFK